MEHHLENKEKPSEMSDDGDVKAEDEQMFQVYVQSYHPVLLRKLKIAKTIKCYYSEYLPRSKRLKDLEDEMRYHVEENHKKFIKGF